MHKTESKITSVGPASAFVVGEAFPVGVQVRAAAHPRIVRDSRRRRGRGGEAGDMARVEPKAVRRCTEVGDEAGLTSPARSRRLRFRGGDAEALGR